MESLINTTNKTTSTIFKYIKAGIVISIAFYLILKSKI